MRARKVQEFRELLADGTIIEGVIWALPRPTPDRPHGYKYRLYCGRAGRCLVRYDNETGKGDHVHYGSEERSYRFVSLTRLVADFYRDVQALTGRRIK